MDEEDLYSEYKFYYLILQILKKHPKISKQINEYYEENKMYSKEYLENKMKKKNSTVKLIADKLKAKTLAIRRNRDFSCESMQNFTNILYECLYDIININIPSEKNTSFSAHHSFFPVIINLLISMQK